MSDENTISVFDALGSSALPDGRPLQARGIAENLQRAADVSVEQLEKSFSLFLTNITRILGRAQSLVGSYQVDRIEIEAVVSADGKIGLVGNSVGVSGKSSLKLILTRPSKEAER